MRVGQGVDAHPFVEGRPLVLGGVTMAHFPGLLGDSDGDVLTHAIMDALLGALAIGDLGTWFRADDPAVHGARSVDLLARVMAMVAEHHYAVVHVDTTVIGEEPKVRPWVPQIRDVLAPVLGISGDALSIKGTTTDGMGWTGRREGLAAMAVVQLVSTDSLNNG